MVESTGYTGMEWECTNNDHLGWKGMLSYRPLSKGKKPEDKFYFPLPNFNEFSLINLHNGRIFLESIFKGGLPHFVALKVVSLEKNGKVVEALVVFDETQSDIDEKEWLLFIRRNPLWQTWGQIKGWFLNGNKFPLENLGL